jgi:hypothetical protein
MKKFHVYAAWEEGYVEVTEHELEDKGIIPGDVTATGYDLHEAIMNLEEGEALSFDQPFNGKQTVVRLKDVSNIRHVVVSLEIDLMDYPGLTDDELKATEFSIYAGSVLSTGITPDKEGILYGDDLGGNYRVFDEKPTTKVLKRYRLTSKEKGYDDMHLTIPQIIDFINAERNAHWINYSELDWLEGLREHTEYDIAPEYL